MPFTPTIINTWPVVNASASVWGGILNDRGGETYTDIQEIALVLNAAETVANDALPKAGGTMTGDIIMPSTGPTNQYSVGIRGTPIVNVTGNKTLALSDAGTKQVMGGSFTATVTVPPIGSVNLESQAIAFRNTSPNPLTISRGSGVTIRLAGSPTNKDIVVSQWGSCVLSNDGGNNWTVSGINIA